MTRRLAEDLSDSARRDPGRAQSIGQQESLAQL